MTGLDILDSLIRKLPEDYEIKELIAKHLHLRFAEAFVAIVANPESDYMIIPGTIDPDWRTLLTFWRRFDDKLFISFSFGNEDFWWKAGTTIAKGDDLLCWSIGTSEAINWDTSPSTQGNKIKAEVVESQ